MTLPVLMVEAAFGGVGNNTYLTFDDPTRGKFNTGTFAPPNTFTDITAYVREVSMSRGRQRPLEAYRAGSCTITLDNRTGAFDPHNLSGPYVNTGVTQVLPMVPVRVRCRFLGTVYDLFYGYADSWDVTYRNPSDSITTLQATDGFKVLANFEPGGPSGTVGAGETSGARIARIADNAGWSAVERDIDTGYSTLQATDLSANALSEMQTVALAELGQVFMSANGKLTFRSRHARTVALDNAYLSGVFNGTTFTDQAATYKYQDIKLAYDDELIKNSVSATITGGTAQTAAASGSIGSYLTKSYNVTNLPLQTDGDAAYWAQQVLVFFKDAEQRVESLSFQFGADDAATTAILAADFGSVFRVRRTPLVGDQINSVVFFDGIAWNITSKGSWSATASFTSAARYAGIVFAGDVGIGGSSGFNDPAFVFSY